MMSTQQERLHKHEGGRGGKGGAATVGRVEAPPLRCLMKGPKDIGRKTRKKGRWLI